MLNEEVIQTALKEVQYPGYSRDIVSFGIVKDIAVANGAVSVAVHLNTPDPGIGGQIKSECERVLKAIPDVRLAHVQIKQPPPGSGPRDPGAAPRKAPGLKRVVAVASGKGGVGKSTVSVNLACALGASNVDRTDTTRDVTRDMTRDVTRDMARDVTWDMT